MQHVTYPDTFKLRSGAGGGDPANGLCFMETVAFIMGEPITDHPQCACPVLTAYGIALNDATLDDQRQRLLPLAVATAGTRSPECGRARLKILGLAACQIARTVMHLTNAPEALAAIKAAETCWREPSAANRAAAFAAARVARDARASAGAADAALAAAAYAAYAAYAAADAAASAAAYAADTATRAAYAAASAVEASGVWDMAIHALREAILAGPHDALGAMAQKRVDEIAPRLPVTV